MPIDDLSASIKGSRPEDSVVDSVLMVGASLDFAGRPEGVNESIMKRFVAILEAFRLPVKSEFIENKQVLLRRAFIQWGGVEPDTIEFLSGHVKAIDINETKGGVDFFTYNQGKRGPKAIIFCGIPKYPEDHQGISDHRDIGGLFSNSSYHHDDDGDWQNFKKRLDELHPDIVFCAGGNDCLSWREFIGPKYVAIKGEGFEQGVLVSRAYLERCEAYLLIAESGLIGAFLGPDNSIVFDGVKIKEGAVEIQPDLGFQGQDLWSNVIG